MEIGATDKTSNPYAGKGGNDTASLIRGFKRSARRVLAPGGEIHINVTQKLLKKHQDAAFALGLPDNKASTLKNLPTFGQTAYYAPFTPHYSTGGAINFYRYGPDRARSLKNFTFH